MLCAAASATVGPRRSAPLQSQPRLESPDEVQLSLCRLSHARMDSLVPAGAGPSFRVEPARAPSRRSKLLTLRTKVNALHPGSARSPPPAAARRRPPLPTVLRRCVTASLARSLHLQGCTHALRLRSEFKVSVAAAPARLELGADLALPDAGASAAGAASAPALSLYEQLLAGAAPFAALAFQLNQEYR